MPTPNAKLSDADIDALTKRTQDGGTEVVQAKAGKVGLLAAIVGLRQSILTANACVLLGQRLQHTLTVANAMQPRHGKQAPCCSAPPELSSRPCLRSEHPSPFPAGSLVACQGSATLSMAYAGALFADACLRGLNGDPDVIECSYVASSITEVPFFSSKVKLGKNGELHVRKRGRTFPDKHPVLLCIQHQDAMGSVLVYEGPTDGMF